MRLVLALAAHYKPYNVRESRRRSPLASYAQVMVLSHSISDMVKKSPLSVVICCMNKFTFTFISFWLIYFLLFIPAKSDCDEVIISFHCIVNDRCIVVHYAVYKEIILHSNSVHLGVSYAKNS